jgi:hypothetical protein
LNNTLSARERLSRELKEKEEDVMMTIEMNEFQLPRWEKPFSEPGSHA